MYRNHVMASAVLLALLATLTVRPATVDAQETRRVGVVVAVTVNVSEEESNKLSSLLGKALRDAFMVDVVAGEETQRRLPPEGLPETCVAETECLQDVGNRLATDELLMIVIAKMGDEVQIDCTWADVKTGKTASRPAITIRGANEDFERIFSAAVTTLLPDAVRREAVTTTEPKNDTGGGTTEGNTVDTTPPAPPPDITKPAPQPQGRHMTALSWTAAGVGVVALGAGILTGVSAKSKYDDCKDNGPCAPDTIKSIDNRALLADVFYGVAIVGGVATLALYFTSGGGSVESPPAVTVGPLEGGVGVSYGGSF